MSDPSPDDIAESARWLGEAAEELRAAERLSGDEDIPARIPCFHAHLAAEKAIKALMIRRGIVVPRIHDLGRLADTLPPDDRSALADADLELLTPWTIDGRYPADLIEVDRETMRDVLDAASRILDEVARRLE